jgi:hypothetical protein
VVKEGFGGSQRQQRFEAKHLVHFGTQAASARLISVLCQILCIM